MAMAHGAAADCPGRPCSSRRSGSPRGGFAMSPRFDHVGLSRPPACRRRRRAADLHRHGRQAAAAGTAIRNPAQADLFERIAPAGAETFYSGDAAGSSRPVIGAPRNPSKMDVADLAAYSAKPRPPLCATYRGYRICGMGPPSSGGFTMLMILSSSSGSTWRRWGRIAGRLASVRRIARGSLMPTATLYLRRSRLRAGARRGPARPRLCRPPLGADLPRSRRCPCRRRRRRPAPRRLAATPPGESPGTTDFVVADRRGNVVELTIDDRERFGSGLVGRRLSAQQRADRLHLRAGGRQAGRQPGRGRQKAAQLDGADHRLRPRRQGAARARRRRRLDDHRPGRQGDGRVLDWKMSAAGRDRARAASIAPGRHGPGRERARRLEAMAPALRAIGHEVQSSPPLGLKANAIERVNGRWVGRRRSAQRRRRDGRDRHGDARRPGRPADESRPPE